MPPVDTSHLISQDLVAYGRAHGLQVGPGKKPGDIAGDPTKSWFVPRDCWKCGARPGEHRFEAAFAVHTAEAHGGDAAATTRTAALARDLHDECNRAVDKYWSKPNKKGDVFCIFDDASDDETVAALGT